MKRYISIVLFIVLPMFAIAQVAVDIKIDSLEMVVGQQRTITLGVSCASNQHVEMPSFQEGQEWIPNVEIVRMLPSDTVLLNEGKSMEISRQYLITAWDSSFYYLPPMKVLVGGKEYLSKSLALKVLTVDVDTVHVDRFFGPKDVMDAPFAWEDWCAVVWFSLLFVLLVVAAIVMTISLRTGKPLIRIIKRKIKEPAHKIALNEIEKIKQDRKWAQEDSKEYYTQLTDTLRTYIQNRYGFSAMEMTSDEIIERLTQENDEEALNELRELFRTADLVKFAKYSTLINENDTNLMTALAYVNQTKQEVDPNQKPEEVVVTPEEKRHRTTTYSLRTGVVIASLAAIGLLAWIVYRIIDLLM